MAIKANASSQGGEFKKFVGVGSFRVLGVNPTKAELEKFYGREMQKEPEYLKDKVDEKDNNKPYKYIRISFMVQADDPANVPANQKETKKTNEVLTSPLKTTINFHLDSRYYYSHKDGIDKVQVIDKYGQTAWVTIEQCKNHQIPVYKNGPAPIDAGYRPCFRGEAELTEFIDNYLNITPLRTYNKNTGEWITNPHPEDCEGWLEKIKNYFTGDVSELKEYCTYMPDNCVKLLMGVEPDDQGRLQNNIYARITARNGAQSYTVFKDKIDGDKKYAEEHGKEFNAVYSNDPLGIIKKLEVYEEDVKETNLNNAPVNSQDPFAAGAALPDDDLPFGNPTDEDPFASVA